MEGLTMHSSRDTSLSQQWIYGAFFLSFNSAEQVVKADLLWQKSREKQLTARPLGKSPSHFQALLVSVQGRQSFSYWQQYHSSTPGSRVSSKKTLCKFHSCRHLCERVTVREIASQQIWIWMASVSPVVNSQSHTEFHEAVSVCAGWGTSFSWLFILPDLDNSWT